MHKNLKEISLSTCTQSTVYLHVAFFYMHEGVQMYLIKKPCVFNVHALMCFVFLKDET